MNEKLILVVDDTPQNIQVVSAILKGHYKIKVATNGERALAMVANEPPDLILLDVIMPGLDGYRVCQKLKENPQTADIPIIFLTAKTEVDDETRGFETGAVDYIHKPFNPSIVQARIRTQLALKDALHKAEEARRQADDLLEVLMPKMVADELRTTGYVIPKRHEKVAVLFCDVVNFTKYCDHHEPEDVISRLDALFLRFESVTRQFGMEKIKTIGDAFMSASGLLTSCPDALATAVSCGLEMSSCLQEACLEWEVRVGVHAGPVVAGIVGQARYQFDIWGDPVNMAARLAGQGDVGSVAVVESVWHEIADRFEGRSLGRRHIKGKGETVVYEILNAKS